MKNTLSCESIKVGRSEDPVAMQEAFLFQGPLCISFWLLELGILAYSAISMPMSAAAEPYSEKTRRVGVGGRSRDDAAGDQR